MYVLRPMSTSKKKNSTKEDEKYSAIRFLISLHFFFDAMEKDPSDPLVVYVIVRSDLLSEPYSWPLGALLAQVSHASMSAARAFGGDGLMKEYLDEGERMHKVVLSVKDGEDLTDIKECLESKNVLCVMWTEHPENISTCIVTEPKRKSEFRKIKKLKRLRLFS
eukprot:TRINITY_DN514_c0_g1_i1.p1 TRINITY_DN514_c0_g1~~TRINITY_DN514_c0_g1_i1.p1  ORF type:complete len:164 (-),score=36.58 TRINITY_DN514_c0_g1_i1:29-520(-)